LVQQLIIENISIDVERKNIGSLRLVVYPPTGRVRLAVPLWLNDEALRSYVVSKLSWIKKHQKKIAARKPQAVYEYISGEKHLYNGNQYVLDVIPHNGKSRVVAEDRTLKLFVRKNNTKRQRATILAEWYRAQLKEQIPGLIKTWETRMGVEVRAWGIKRMKTRWGSCNIRAQRIWLNLELAKSPVRCWEYVLVHEMAHLIERNHSKRFAALMSEFLPPWKLLKEELKSGR
jgi:predicted metal-dependent hydrolase